MRYAYQPVPGMTKVQMLNSEALMWGGTRSTAGFSLNGSLISYPSGLYDSIQRPGFDVKPASDNWCYNPNNATPFSESTFSVSTSAGLAASLQQVSTTVEGHPEALAMALTFFPYVSGCRGARDRDRDVARAGAGVNARAGPGPGPVAKLKT